jgi:hypothetical protein
MGHSVVPGPAYGYSKDGQPDLKEVLLSLRVSNAGGLPLRMGIRDGNTSDSMKTPVAIEERLALGGESVIGIVADSKAYSQRTLGLTVVGLLVYGLIQRQVQLSLQNHQQHLSGHKGPTATPQPPSYWPCLLQ